MNPTNPSYSFWVSASAGTGKTKLLVDRVLSLLLAGVEPGKILCLTFTKAAAAEMSNRINKILGKWVLMENGELKNELAILLEKEPGAQTVSMARKLFAHVIDSHNSIKIQTIHSFCQSLLGKFPLESGVSPNFRVIDEQTANELLDEAQKRLLLNLNESEAPELFRSVQNIARNTADKSFNQIIKGAIAEKAKFFDYFNVPGGKERLVDNIYKSLGVGELKTAAEIVEEILKLPCHQKVIHVAEILKNGTKGDKERSGNLLNVVSNIANEQSTHKTAEQYVQVFLTKKEGTIRKNLASQNSKKSGIADFLLEEAERIAYLNDQLKAIRIVGLSGDLVNLCEGILVLYEDLKRVHSYLDYNDLIIKTRDLLQDESIAPWIMYKLDGGIDHILVDEAQDTSQEQWGIISSIFSEFFAGFGSREDNDKTLFIVGDEKQSIFSFQGADHKLFAEVNRSFTRHALASDKNWENVTLQKSYRSTEPVLRAVDLVFSQSTVKEEVMRIAGEISHQAHRVNAKGIMELWPLVPLPEEGEDIGWKLPDKILHFKNPKYMLALIIAEKINEWVSKGRIIDAKGRVVRAGDIMILVRRRDEFTGYMERALKSYNISVAGTDRMILTEHIAVMDLLALAKFTLLPEDDLNLATILKTPLIGFSEDELQDAAYDRGNKSLWLSLKERKEQKEQKEQHQRFSAAVEFLSELLRKAEDLRPYEFFISILEENNSWRKIIARLGKQAGEPLREFLAQVLVYESSHTPSMQGFVHWLESGQIQIKREFAQDADEVRIMTVHAAKGLQAPIVFMPDTTGLPNISSKPLWLDDDEPVLVWPTSMEKQSQKCSELYKVENDKAYAEYLRLLYVAMTRAEDELYICGYEYKKQKYSQQSWYEIVRSGIADEADEITFNIKNFDDEGDYKVLRITNEKKAKQADSYESDKKQEMKQAVKAGLPDFITTVPDTEGYLLPSVSPSKFGNSSTVFNFSAGKQGGYYYLRGNLIHTLLQFLPDIPSERHESAAYQYLSHYKNHFSEEEIGQIISETMAVIHHPEFEEFFGKNTQAEVDIVGVIGGKKVSGRIDRICITDKDIYIIDYKTNQNPPATENYIPKQYITQIAIYRDLVAQVYPNRNIHSAILWTNKPDFTILSNEMLSKFNELARSA